MKIASHSKSEDECPKKMAKQKRKEKVEKCVNILQEKHGTTFSQTHSKTDTPPSSSMFNEQVMVVVILEKEVTVLVSQKH